MTSHGCSAIAASDEQVGLQLFVMTVGVRRRPS